MNNSLCFVGPHRKYNPFSNQYHELVPGQGHFGPGKSAESFNRFFLIQHASMYSHTRCCVCCVCRCHSGRRSLAPWRGGVVKAARDNMVSIEVAAQAQMFLQKRQ